MKHFRGSFLTVGQAAEILGKTRITITRWCESGKLPAMAVPYGGKITYRISPAALELVVQEVTKPAQKKAKSKPQKVHAEYVTAWETAMTRGTLTGKAYSPRTIEIYKLYVEFYLQHHASISVQGVEKELLKIPGKHFAKREKLWKSLLCFGKFLVRQDVLDSGFLERMNPLQPKRHLPPKRFTVDESGLLKLLEACETAQEQLIVTLLSHTGLRASEACALKWKDINLEQGFLTVHCGKGGKTRRVGLPKSLTKLLEQLCTAEAHQNGAILRDKNGKPMVRNGLYQRLERIGKAAKVKVSPHALRRAFVTINANKGRSLVMLQMACGHSDITTTRNYCLTSEQEVIEAMQDWN